MITSKEDHTLFNIAAKEFSLSVQNQGGAYQTYWCRVFVCTFIWHLVAAGYPTKHPDWSCRLTPIYHYRHCLLADRPQILNHKHWSHVIFHDESGVSLYHFDHHANWFQQLLGSKHLLAIQKTIKKLKHTNYSCRCWLWPHQQIAHETSAAGSSSGACMPIYSGGGDGQKSLWGISLDVLSGIQLLLNIFGPCVHRHGVQFVWSALTSSYALRKKLFQLMIRRRVQSSIGMIVFNRCPLSSSGRQLLSWT